MLMNIQNLVLFCQFILKILSKTSILTSIKGRYSVANLPKFELIQAFMHFLVTCKNEEDHIKSKNQILTSIKGRYSVANLQKTKIYNTYVDLVNDNVYTKFGLNLLIRSQDIEQKPNSDVNQGP